MTELGINWGVGPHFSYRWASPASPSCGRLGSPATGGRRRATREPIEGCPASPSHRTGPGRLPGSSGPRWGRCRCGAGPACWCGCVPAHTPARVLRWMVASLAAPGPCWLVGSPGVSRLPFVDRARSKGLPQDRERSPRQTLRPAASDGLPAIGGRLDAFNDWASRAEAVTLRRLRNAGWFVSGMPLSGLDDAGGHEVGELRRWSADAPTGTRWASIRGQRRQRVCGPLERDPFSDPCVLAKDPRSRLARGDGHADAVAPFGRRPIGKDATTAAAATGPSVLITRHRERLRPIPPHAPIECPA